MIQNTDWPPPRTWTAVEVPWEVMLEHSGMCHAVLDWCKQHPSSGEFQLRGSKPNPTDGYRFYFELPEDATTFILKWK